MNKINLMGKKKACTCGAASVGDPGHTDYCALSEVTQKVIVPAFDGKYSRPDFKVDGDGNIELLFPSLTKDEIDEAFAASQSEANPFPEWAVDDVILNKKETK